MSSTKKTPERHGIFQAASPTLLTLTKMLQQQPLDIKKTKLQMLKSIFYPPTLLTRGALKYGWLAAIPLKKTTKEQRAQIEAEIANIEKNKGLQPYDKVAAIVEAIKSITGKRFIADSAFRQMMNAKFNDYVFAQNIDQITGIEDAVNIIERNSVPSKGMSLVGAIPELFHQDSPLKALITKEPRRMLYPDNEEEILKRALKSTSNLTFGKVMDGALEAAAKAKVVLTRFYKNESDYQSLTQKSGRQSKAVKKIAAMKAAIFALEEIKQTLGLHSQNPKDALDVLESIKLDTKRLSFEQSSTIAKYTHEIERHIKSIRVEQLPSAATTLIACAGYAYDKRQPIVTCVDKILNLDDANGYEIWRMDCAQIISAAQNSILPNRVDKITANQKLRDATRAAIDQSFGAVDWSSDKTTWLGSGYAAVNISTVANNPQQLATIAMPTQSITEKNSVSARIELDHKIMGDSKKADNSTRRPDRRYTKLRESLKALGAEDDLISVALDTIANPKAQRWASTINEAMQSIDYLDKVGVLGEIKANPKAKDVNGNPPLHAILKAYAPDPYAYHIAHELTEAGASFTATGYYGVPMSECIPTPPNMATMNRFAANMATEAASSIAREQIEDVFSDVANIHKPRKSPTL